MMMMDILETTGATDGVTSEAPEAAGEQQTSAAPSSSPCSSQVTDSPTLLTLSDATSPATAAPVTLIKNENPSERLDMASHQQAEQVVTINNNNGLCLTLSAEEEEDSQLKCSISSSNDGDGDDDDDDDDDDTRQANLVSPNRAEQLYASEPPAPVVRDTNGNHTNDPTEQPTIELRLLVRRREAGALIGKRGTNIKRLREKFRGSMFSIPDTGNGPERVVCVATSEKSMELILDDLAQLLMEKSPENDDQIELKLLIHSSQAGSIIGMGGQSIKKLRNDSKAAIKIYELCCPLSNERVCAIKARPPVVVNTIKLIQSILNENPIKGTIKPYDALHFDLMLADKYGGFLPDDGGGGLEPISHHHAHYPQSNPIYNHHHSHRPRAPAMVAYSARQFNHATSLASVFKHCPLWRPTGVHDQHLLEMDNDSIAHHLERLEYFRQQAMDHQSIAAQLQQQHHHHHQQQPTHNQMAGSSTPPQLHLHQPTHQCHHHDHQLYPHNHCRGQQRTIKQESGLHCDEPKLTKLYNPSGHFGSAAAAAATRPAHLFRYHPYAAQVAGPPALPCAPVYIRPSLRHHHQQPLVGGQVYVPAAGSGIYADHPIQNNRNEFCNRMQAISDGSPHQLATAAAAAADRCRHMKPCSCTPVPSPVESTRPNNNSPGQPVGLLANK